MDVPIGLPMSGAREADLEARRMLGAPRSTSVFPAPIRQALRVESREEASEITKAADGRGVTLQTFAILPKIREVDRVLRSQPKLHSRVYEVHPEVSFSRWAGRPLRYSKRKLNGYMERRRLVDELFGPHLFDELLTPLRRLIRRDDLADAFAALWTAKRIHSGEARCLPDEPVFDSTGVRMNIWY